MVAGEVWHRSHVHAPLSVAPLPRLRLPNGELVSRLPGERNVPSLQGISVLGRPTNGCGLRPGSAGAAHPQPAVTGPPVCSQDVTNDYDTNNAGCRPGLDTLRVTLTDCEPAESAELSG